jgi:hypothetical protein
VNLQVLDAQQHSSALRIAAIQAGIAAIHHHHRGGAALRAELRPFRKMRF